MLVSSPLQAALAFVLVATAAVLPPAHSHGFLVKPKTTFSTYGGGYSAIVDSSTLTPPAGKKFIWFQNEIAGVFESALKPTKQSLKDFILAHQDTSVQAEGAPKPLSAACGFSNPRGTPQPLPDALEWEMNFQHPGPCEVYCDDELVVPYTTDCWNTFANSRIPYDRAKCVGKKQLTLYFLAVHYPPWQVYINCVPLAGASTSNNNSSSRVSPAPAVTTLKPSRSPVTTAPVTVAPVPASVTPAPSMKPATTKPVTPPTPSKTPTTAPSNESPAPEATQSPVSPTPASPVTKIPTSNSGASGCKVKARRT